MSRLLQRIRGGETLICDGAMGTQLMARGLKAGECPEEWCLTHPQHVAEIAAAYAAAGSDVLETNSFGGSTIKLAPYGLANKAYEINRAAAQIAKGAIGDKGFVAASVGPTGQFLQGEGGKLTEQEAYDTFAIQIKGLADGGADAICVETMWSLREASQAIKAAKANTSLPVLCTFTFNAGKKGYRTAVGLTAAAAAKGAVEAGADVVGANCGAGIEQMIEIAREMRNALPHALLMFQPNAGLPIFEDGKTVYNETPELMAKKAAELIALGISILGGCCGTTPEHIGEMKALVLQQTR